MKRRLRSINNAINKDQIKSEGNTPANRGMQYRNKSSKEYQDQLRRIMKDRRSQIMEEKLAKKRKSFPDNVIIEES